MSALLERRRAGVLLHITSLPNQGQAGDLGREAYHFVNFLHSVGVTVWQTLPLGMPHSDGSPYQCLSAHAGNPALISIDWLVDRGWLQSEEVCSQSHPQTICGKSCLLSKAFFWFSGACQFGGSIGFSAVLYR